MKYNISKRYALVAVISVLAGSLVTVGVVKSAVPHSQTGMVTACYKTSGSITDPKGNLRVIDAEANEECDNDEVALDLNTQATGDLMVDKLSNADLEAAHLQYMNLVGTDFQNSQLIETFLTGSKLDNANFGGATISTRKFNRLSANNANFSGAAIDFVTEGSTLHNSNFSNAVIATIFGGDFTGSDFSHSVVDSIGYANLTNADFRNASIAASQAYISHSDMTGANFSGLALTNYGFRFDSDNFTNANFSGAVFNTDQPMYFDSDTVVGANFSGASFTNVVFQNTDLTAADLTDATWSNVTCPDTTNSNDHDNTCIGHLSL